MKPRRVTILLEVETNAPLYCLRDRGSHFVTTFKSDGFYGYQYEVKQVQVNAIRSVKQPPARRGKVKGK